MYSTSNMVLTKKGEVYVWGENSLASLGLGQRSVAAYSSPVLNPTTIEFKTLCIGRYNAFAIDNDDNLYAWGDATIGIVPNNNGTGGYVLTPTQILTDRKIRLAHYSQNVGVAVTLEDELYAWGWDNVNRVRVNPFVIEFDKQIKQLFVETYNIIIVTEDGEIYLINTVTTNISTPIKVYQYNQKVKYAQKADRSFNLIILDEDNKFHYLTLPTGTSREITAINTLNKEWKDFSTNGVVHAFVSKENELYTLAETNSSTSGMMGDGTSSNKIVPTRILPNEKIESSLIQANNAIVINDKGELFAWGLNSNYGEVGTGNSSTVNTPVKLAISEVVAISEWKQIKSFTNKNLILHDGEYKKYIDVKLGVTPEPLVPIMTSDLTPSPFKITASKYNGSDFPYKAFNNTVDTTNRNYWYSGTIPSSGHWLKVDTGEFDKYIVNKYSINSFDTYRPTDWNFEGSDDNSNWVIINSQTAQTYTDNVDKFYNFENTKPYRYYRISVLRTSVGTTVVTPIISKFNLYGNIIEKINTWETVSSSLPTTEQFTAEGMDSLSPLLDRKVTTLEPMQMQSKSDILPVGSEGKVFSKIVDLNKYLDIRSMKVEVK